MFFKTNFRPANERVRSSIPKIVLLVSRFFFGESEVITWSENAAAPS